MIPLYWYPFMLITGTYEQRADCKYRFTVRDRHLPLLVTRIIHFGFPVYYRYFGF